ncbi:hypothetical protein AX16_009310 [Volvariella volvacea WC 439]|nr:hypothetical protein AX16_009310 [Volvariella volvacea WC 439]
MVNRAFCIPGVVILFCAFVLSFLVSVSLPYLPALDITRIRLASGFVADGDGGVTQYRFGIWSACWYDTNETRTCLRTGHGYVVALQDAQRTASVVIGSSWTRGLAIHPVATAVTFIALLLSFSSNLTVTLFASLASFLAAFLTLLAFACDIALFAYVKHQVGKLPNVNVDTIPAPAFWMTLVVFILLLIAGCTVCFGRRRERMADASYPKLTNEKPSLWDRIRRKSS